MNAPVNPKMDEEIKKALSQLGQREAIFTGIIQDISQPQNGDYNYFVLGLQAKDGYSLPPVVQISQSSKQKLFAQKGEEVVIHVELGGYPRKASGTTYYSNTYTLISRLF